MSNISAIHKPLPDAPPDSTSYESHQRTIRNIALLPMCLSLSCHRNFLQTKASITLDQRMRRHLACC